MEIAQIRQLVLDSLPDYGASATEPNWETLLITDGRYVGRRFEFDNLRAFWFRERHLVEFYDHQWQLLGELKLPGRALAWLDRFMISHPEEIRMPSPISDRRPTVLANLESLLKELHELGKNVKPSEERSPPRSSSELVIKGK